MRIIRLELILDIDLNSRVMTPAQKVFRAFGGKVGKGKEPIEPRALISDDKNKFAIRWEYDSCGILFEDVDNQHPCFIRMANVLDTINGVAPFGNLESRMIKIYWILPAGKYDFSTLEQKYRQLFIKENELFQNCMDSSAIIEMRYGNSTLHHQSGPMTVNQLQTDFKEFKIKEGTPELFLFLSTTLTNRESIKYQSENIDTFIKKSFDICKLHSDKFESIMEKIL